jgi:hypothetical protein
MKIDSTKHFFLLIVALSITPFILFLGKNFLQTDFFTAKYYFLAVVYCLFFISIAICGAFLSKKLLILVLFSAYFSFLQFYFHDIQQFLRIYNEGSTGYYVLGLIILVSLIGTFFSRSSIYRNFIFILLFLNVTLTVINLTPVIGKSLQTFFNPANTPNKTLNTKSLISKKYPNIFYIVPDGLSSPKILKNYADISFEDSIKNFEEKGFSVPKHSYSSYNITHLSLAALFEMDYPVTEKSLVYKDRSDFYPSIREKKPELLQYLTKNNYKLYIVPPLWGGCPSSKEYRCITPKSSSYLKNFFQDYAISTFIQSSFFYKVFNKYNLFRNEDMNDAIKTTLNEMKKNPNIWSEGGVFTMIHAMMPHLPYREENCSITDSYTPPSKRGYRSSVYCTFNRIHELSDFIIKNYPNATIVVQGDHGIYTEKQPMKFAEFSNSLIDSRLGIFTAVSGCNSSQAAKLNQANIVNYIVECIVNGTQTKQLENKSFFGFYENHPEYGKVFRVRQK